MNPSRETVVLLHSSASSSRQWSALAESLQSRFAVHVIDFHGHGEQPDWSGDRPLTLADEAALVEPLLRESGGAHVVGHSYGAAVALKVATLHPQLVRSVVAYEPVLFGWLMCASQCDPAVRKVVALVDSIRECLARGDEHATAARFVGYWSGSGAWDSISGGRQQAVATRMRAVLLHFGAVFGESFQSEDIAALEMPMLFLKGEHTVESTRRIGALLRDARPDAEHQALAGMAHMGPITHVAEVNKSIRTFLLPRGHMGRALEAIRLRGDRVSIQTVKSRGAP